MNRTDYAAWIILVLLLVGFLTFVAINHAHYTAAQRAKCNKIHGTYYESTRYRMDACVPPGKNCTITLYSVDCKRAN